jgi:hypothetical protein
MTDLVLALRDSLPDGFDNELELLHWSLNSCIDELQLWRNQLLEFFHSGLIVVNVAYGVRSVGVLANEIVLSLNGGHDCGKVCSKASAGCEQSYCQQQDAIVARFQEKLT